MKYTMETIKEKIQRWGSDLRQLEGTDRFEFLIEQARLIEPLEDQYKVSTFKIQGCASQLWVVPEIKETECICE
jgi:cysteine desulfuration protein SufE